MRWEEPTPECPWLKPGHLYLGNCTSRSFRGMPQKKRPQKWNHFLYHTTSAHMLRSTLVHAERSKIPWPTILDPLDVDPAGSTMLDPQ